jgi:hypothetical protein
MEGGGGGGIGGGLWGYHVLGVRESRMEKYSGF